MFSRHYPVPQPCKVRAGCCVALWQPARFADCQSGVPARRPFGGRPLAIRKRERETNEVVIGFVLVFLPGVLVALVWGFAHGVVP